MRLGASAWPHSLPAHQSMQDLVENELIVIYDQSTMELRQLVYVEAVARHRHFTRAAEELHVAQSALSHQIRRLEARARHRALRAHEPPGRADRGGRGGRRPRSPGRRRARQRPRRDRRAARAGPRPDRGRRAAARRRDRGHRRCWPASAEAFPGIEVALREGTAADMLSLLEADELDAAFSLVAGELPERIASLRAERGGGRRRLSAGRRPRPRARHGRRPRGDPARRAARRARRSRRPPTSSSPAPASRFNVTLESGDPYLIRCLVSDGFSAAVLPASLARREGPPVETRPLSPPVRLPVFVLWRRDRPPLGGRDGLHRVRWNGTITFGTRQLCRSSSTRRPSRRRSTSTRCTRGTAPDRAPADLPEGRPRGPERRDRQGLRGRARASTSCSRSDEIKAAAGDRGKVIDLEEFVDAAEIDPVFFEKTYYVGSARRRGRLPAPARGAAATGAPGSAASPSTTASTWWRSGRSTT